MPGWQVISAVTMFGLLSSVIGFAAGLFDTGLLESRLWFILLLSLLVFPSILEEIVFRGLLIPRSAFDKRWAEKARYLAISTTLFVLWHPLNALTINPGAKEFFLNPGFLGIVALLGLTCGYTYMQTRSLWVPIAIHWMTVLVWVFFLGGRNLVL